MGIPNNLLQLSDGGYLWGYLITHYNYVTGATYGGYLIIHYCYVMGVTYGAT
jgi:hypothetical protein